MNVDTLKKAHITHTTHTINSWMRIAVYRTNMANITTFKRARTFTAYHTQSTWIASRITDWIRVMPDDWHWSSAYILVVTHNSKHCRIRRLAGIVLLLRHTIDCRAIRVWRIRLQFVSKTNALELKGLPRWKLVHIVTSVRMSTRKCSRDKCTLCMNCMFYIYIYLSI